jgi:hypothetical protein
MDYKNVQSARRENMRDIPAETDIDYEKDEPLETTGARDKKDSAEEYLKKMGRQTEV